MSRPEISHLTPFPDDTRQRRKWTRDECKRLRELDFLPQDQHYELIAGEIFEKTGRNPPHVFAQMQMFQSLQKVFGSDFLQTQAAIAIDEYNEPKPSLCTLRLPVRDYQAVDAPPAKDVNLSVEISDSFLAFCRSTKALLYAQASIPEYWIVDITGRQLLVHRQPKPNGYASIQAFPDIESVSPVAAPEAIIRIADLLP